MGVLWAIRRFPAAAASLCTLSPKCAEAQTAPALDPISGGAARILRINDGTFHGVATAWHVGDSLGTGSAGTASATAGPPPARAAGHATSGWTDRASRWRGSAIDPARLAIAASATINGPLASTFALMMRTRSPGPDPIHNVALGWRVMPLEGRDTYWHDAHDAQGFSIYVALDPRRRPAAEAFGNNPRPVAAVAEHLLPGRVPSIAAVPTPSPASKSLTPTRARRRGQN